MAELGSKERPIVVRVQTEQRAGEIAAICDQHHWYFIAGLEPDKPEDVRELENALNPPSPIRVAAAPGRNAFCPCGSGKKYKKCCGKAL